MRNSTDGKPSGKKVKPLRLVDLKLFNLGDKEGPNARLCSHEEFKGFISSIVGFGPGVEVNKWTVTRRRDVLNFCLSAGVLQQSESVLSRIKNSTELNKEIQQEAV